MHFSILLSFSPGRNTGLQRAAGGTTLLDSTTELSILTSDSYTLSESNGSDLSSSWFVDFYFDLIEGFEHFIALFIIRMDSCVRFCVRLVRRTAPYLRFSLRIVVFGGVIAALIMYNGNHIQDPIQFPAVGAVGGDLYRSIRSFPSVGEESIGCKFFLFLFIVVVFCFM